VDQRLQTEFRRYDDTRDKAVLGAVRGLLNRRRYIQNLVSGVDKELAGSALSN
jgi:hypothetical protein